MIKLQIDKQVWAEATAILGDSPKKLEAAAQSAINRTLTNVKTQISKKVRENYTVGAADIKKSLKVTNARRGAIRGVILSTGGALPLKAFKVSPKQPAKFAGRQKGVLVATVKRSHGARTVRGGFWAKMRSGHIGVFKRTRSSRLPIDEEMRLSVPQMIGNREIINEIEKTAEAKLNERLAHEVEYRFRGR